MDQSIVSIFTSSIQSLGDLLYSGNNAMFWVKVLVPLKDSYLVEDADISNFKNMVSVTMQHVKCRIL